MQRVDDVNGCAGYQQVVKYDERIFGVEQARGFRFVEAEADDGMTRAGLPFAQREVRGLDDRLAPARRGG